MLFRSCAVSGERPSCDEQVFQAFFEHVERHQECDSARMIAILAGLGPGVPGALGTWPLAPHGRIGFQILASGCPRKSSYQGRRALHLVDEVEPVRLANEFHASGGV